MTTKCSKIRPAIKQLYAGSLLIASLALPAAQANSIVFSDNFTSSTLNSAWQVLPGQGSYSVGGGHLTYFNDGPQASTTGWISPALTLALSIQGTNWEVETKASYNLQYLDGEGNSSGAQGPEMLVAFAPGQIPTGTGGINYAGSDFAGIERDIDAYYGANYVSAFYGGVSSPSFLNPADMTIQNNIAGGTYWYQIIRDGGVLTINYSYDGTDWVTALSEPLADPTSSYNDLLLGGNTWATVGSFTNYDFVTVTSLASVPEPGNLFLLGLGLIGLSVLRFRAR